MPYELFEMSRKEALEIEKVLKALGNLTRIKFIRYLRENPNSSFTTLCYRGPTGPINSASFKFHMDILIDAGIVERNEDGYNLSTRGKKIYPVVEHLLSYLRKKK